MSEKEIIENNILIAKFMEYPNNGVFYSINVFNPETLNSRTHHEQQLHFQDSWEWIMPVIEKIESLGYSYERDTHYRINIGEKTFLRTDGKLVQYIVGNNNRDGLYKICVEFIKWNNNKNNEKTIDVVWGLINKKLN